MSFDFEHYQPMQEMDQYIEDVQSGEIRSCKTVRNAIKRHIRDLEKQRTDDFPYYFDREYAEAVVSFFPVMIKHSIGRDVGQPLVLQPWQVFAVASIFGWKKTSDDCRRFSKAMISPARKNGKSTLAAAIALFAGSMDYNPVSKGFENVAQVLLAATKKEQSMRVVFAEACRMRAQSEELSSMSTLKNNQIFFKHNQGSIFCVGSDKPLDGFSASLTVIDELAAFRSDGGQKAFVETMLTQGGARSQPLTLFITTAGNDNSFLWLEQYNYGKGVVSLDFHDESYFFLNYELDEDDDVYDPENWVKANPCLGVTIMPEYLEDQAKPAKTDVIVERRFKKYHCNIVTSSNSAAFSLEQWDACAGEFSDWQDADAVGCGVDLGGRDDLAAFALVARFETGEFTQVDEHAPEVPIYRYEARTWQYISTDTTRDITQRPFADFIENDLIRTTRFPTNELERDLLRECQRYRCYDVAYDPYNSQSTAERLETEGLEPASMTQSCRYQNEPIQELRACIADGRFLHDGNSCLKWMIGNAVLVHDRQDRVMFDKKASAEKIDGVVAMTMALGRAMHASSKSNGYFTY